MLPTDLTEILHDPDQLEEAFQSDPSSFRRLHLSALRQHPDSETLLVWQARLTYEERHQLSIESFPQKSYQHYHHNNQKQETPLWFVVLLCFAAFALVKLPTWFAIDESWFAARFLLPSVLGMLGVYFIRCEWVTQPAAGTKQSRTKRWFLIIAAVMCALLYAAWLPDSDTISSANKPAVVMALLHLPLFYLSLLALCFMGGQWGSSDARIRFIRYLGEVGTLTLLILIGGVVLTLISLGLFNVIGLSLSDFYLEYIVVLGLVSAPLVATYVYDEVLQHKARFASLLANIFAPLFLVTVLVYLLAMLVQQTSPVDDRDYLITLNGLLLIILAITLFSLAGRSSTADALAGSEAALKQTFSRWRLTDLIALALISVTLLVDLITLGAIVLRWAEFGLTLNRVVVTGSNLLIFGHLLMIARRYLSLMLAARDAGAAATRQEHRQKQFRQKEQQLQSAVTGYLPLYSVWSLIVIVLLPQIF